MTVDIFTWDHFLIAIVLYLLIGGVAYWLFPRSASVGAAVLLGPFAGPGLRNWSHSLEWAWQLLPFAIGCLGLGVLAQFLIKPETPTRQNIRLIVWALAWAAWFSAAILSYAVALE